MDIVHKLRQYLKVSNFAKISSTQIDSFSIDDIKECLEDEIMYYNHPLAPVEFSDYGMTVLLCEIEKKQIDVSKDDLENFLHS